MKSIVIFILLGVLGFEKFVQATDYCSDDICPSGEKHIGCNNSGDFGDECPSDVEEVTMTEEMKDNFLKFHNEKRNELAAGNVEGFKSAVKMSTLQWDDELAKLASFNVKTCKFEHDKCRNTDKYKNAGQNLAQSMSSEKDGLTSKDQMNSLMNDWWNEKKDTTMSDINKYPQSTSADIGHFTCMAQEESAAVGCAATTFKDSSNGMYTVLLACNYGKTNMIGEPVYESGETASKCETGTDSKYESLCSTDEKY